MTYYEENTPSDQYYSDFDDDWFHEVFVGRVSVGNTTEINTFINKVLKYEKDPPRTDYPLDVLLIGMDLDTYTLGEDLKEYINSYIPERFNVTKVYDSDPGYHRTPIINALNAGQNLVNHADHSDWNCQCRSKPGKSCRPFRLELSGRRELSLATLLYLQQQCGSSNK